MPRSARCRWHFLPVTARRTSLRSTRLIERQQLTSPSAYGLQHAEAQPANAKEPHMAAQAQRVLDATNHGDQGQRLAGQLDPLRPVEKKLIGWSLGLGVSLLGILLLMS